jgi:peroxiredoxin
MLLTTRRLIGVLVLVAMAGCQDSGRSAPTEGSAPSRASSAAAPVLGLAPGQQPPDFSAKDLAGQPHSLKQHAGDVVLLHFWATWCPYCRQEIPRLRQIHQEHAGQGVHVLAISVDENLEALRDFVAQQQLPYPVISEVQNRQPISAQYGVAGIPTTYLIDANGLVAGRFQGQGDLPAAVRRLLEFKQQHGQ